MEKSAYSFSLIGESTYKIQPVARVGADCSGGGKLHPQYLYQKNDGTPGERYNSLNKKSCTSELQTCLTAVEWQQKQQAMESNGALPTIRVSRMASRLCYYRKMSAASQAVTHCTHQASSSHSRCLSASCFILTQTCVNRQLELNTSKDATARIASFSRSSTVTTVTINGVCSFLE